jgi:hypothetical protein
VQALAQLGADGQQVRRHALAAATAHGALDVEQVRREREHRDPPEDGGAGDACVVGAADRRRADADGGQRGAGRSDFGRVVPRGERIGEGRADDDAGGGAASHDDVLAEGLAVLAQGSAEDLDRVVELSLGHAGTEAHLELEDGHGGRTG